MQKPPRPADLLLRSLLGATSCAALLIAQGCTVGPTYVRPPVATPASYKEATAAVAADGTTWTPADPQDAALRGAWWKIYQEPELDELEDRLNASNQNIAQAYQNYVAARAQVAQARANYSPTATLQPAYTRSGSPLSVSAGSSGSSLSGARVNSNDFTFPLDISWEPDLWGRIRNTVKEFSSAAQVSAADLANEKLSQQATLAQDYFELRGQDELIGLDDRTIDAYRKSLALTEVLGRTGIDSAQSVAQAQLNLRTAEASATNARLARAQYEHAIALLIGEPASSFSMPVKPLTTTAPTIPAGVPSALLQRRPDIAAAERSMSQANALIGVETAAFYPSISISLSGGFESSTLANWFAWPARFFSLGPSVSETLFDGGLRSATVAQYKAQYEGAVASYRQTVLTAFQQTEDYLAAQRILAQQIEQQAGVVAAAQRYYDLAAVRYRTGVDTYLNVFVAQTALFSDQQSAITLHVQQMTSSVQLIEALGGGWSSTLLTPE
ncbi:efflux transporter outer membrane subunit [Paraburkholderia bryophila]|uniref:NodT family efflux transporter outer membrane factor (OMF) lipoprotein n=1 Tax=Paraburkholderia bryophila TaxID=420952 RepID=A0A7Y9WSL4_9BURK|nr:efflux transporter outer membrane subunit [Paraburkholderia bryophila]NYH16186.1 NodT family efflux transporter outer membrane factor (OMF) lipoprotein [Paraburkholderia bryophila]NYH25381.1 NodT family efflux transporter outer membrane factor (OMF) lipoprotein [Paraburkholderia bryophila]